MGQPRRAPDITGDIARDVKRGQEVLGSDFAAGSLGRLETGRSADVSSVVEGRRAALGGFSSEESQALRERAGQGIDRGTQTAVRQLRAQQGASGVRGASAAAQVGRQLSAGQSAKAQAERDLLIQSVGQRGKALSAFEGSVAGAEQGEQQREMFNIGQTQAETLGRQAAGLGFAQLSTLERTGKRSADAAAASGQSSGKK